MVSVKSITIIIITWVLFFSEVNCIMFTNIFSIFLKQEHWFIVETVTQQQLSSQNRIRYTCTTDSLDVAHAHTCTHRDVITVVIGQSWTKTCTLIYPHLLHFSAIITTIIKSKFFIAPVS